jgi:hypothetical protein
MKDLGEADVILNIKLIKGENGITLLQSHYVEKMLKRFGYKDSKSSPTSKEQKNWQRPIEIFTDDWLTHVSCECNET